MSCTTWDQSMLFLPVLTVPLGQAVALFLDFHTCVIHGPENLICLIMTWSPCHSLARSPTRSPTHPPTHPLIHLLADIGAQHSWSISVVGSSLLVLDHGLNHWLWGHSAQERCRARHHAVCPAHGSALLRHLIGLHHQPTTGKQLTSTLCAYV